MSIFKPRNFIKPYQYPQAAKFKEMADDSHWLPKEVPMIDDLRHWRNELSPKQKHFLTQIFRFFTQSDADVAGGYCNAYIPAFLCPEIRSMLLAFGYMETIHIDAYAMLIDQLGMPETEFQAFSKYKEMTDKHEYVISFDKAKSKADIAKSMAVYSAFTEGLQLFASFAMLLSFQLENLMPGMIKIVKFSIRDESLHVQGLMWLFKQFMEEHPKVLTKSLVSDIGDIAKKMVSLEDAFIDLAFEQGGIPQLKKSDMKQYVRYLADRRMLQLGFDTLFDARDNPLEFVDEILLAERHTNFFEQREDGYSKGGMSGSWADFWGI